jgi:phosphatidylserine/phosphatidylglycerophosphate/cardiolipin synthase-like enzyme
VIVDDRVVWMGSWNVTINDTYRNNNNLLRITVPPIVENYEAEFERMAGGAFGNSKSGQTPHPLVRLADAQIENYFSPRERISTRVVDWIDRARVRVDVLAFSFTDNDVGDALIARQQAAVPVRVVFETRNAEGVGSEYGRLRRYGLDVLEDGNCYTMHHKVIIIDERVVITGSYNFTGRAEDVNDENLIIIDSPQIAQAYMAEFERVYRQAQSPTRCE